MNEWMIFSTLAFLLLAISYALWRDRNEMSGTAVTPAQLLEFHEKAQKTAQETAQKSVVSLQRQWDREREEWQQEKRDFRGEIGALREEMKAVQNKAFELGVLVRVYEYRMKAAGIALDVEAHAKVHIAVYYQIVEKMNLHDLRTAVFLLDEEAVKWDSISGETLEAKAQTLVGKLERRGLMPQFLRIVRQEFPFADWPSEAGTAAVPLSPPPAPTPPNNKRPRI